MLISSYTTYVDTSSTQRVQKEKVTPSIKKQSPSFNTKLTPTLQQNITQTDALPIDYISKYKSLKNKQALQEQINLQDPAKTKFMKISSIQSAQRIYGENTKMFSPLQKPKPALNQSPRLSTGLPVLAQEAQSNTMKNIMVNTYTANENYYRITAA